MTFTRRSLLAALTACAMVVTPGAADAAAPGQLHPSFSPFAAQLSDVAGNETATGVAIAPSGRIVTSVVNDVELDRRVLALTADGARDTSFSEDGSWSLPQANETFIRSVAVQPDGKVLFIGDDQSMDNIIVGRLMVDGELDPTFGGGDGLYVITQPAEGSAPRGEQLILQADGRIVIAGSVRTDDRGREIFVGRLTPSGADDSSFAGDPYRLFGSASAVDDHLAGIVQMPNGELIVASAHSLQATGLWRIIATGEGAVIKDLDVVPGPEQPLDLVRVSATKVAVIVNGVTVTTAVARVDVANTPKLDATFGTGGRTMPLPSSFLGQHVQAQPDGKLVIAGVSSEGARHRAIARVTAAGAIDASFGSGGMVHLPGVSAYSAALRAHELALDADGTIVFASHVGELGARVTAVERLVGRIARVRVQVFAPAAPVAGTDVDVRMRVSNDGPDDAGLTALSFALGSGLQLRGVGGAVCVYEGASGGRCHLPSLAAGSSTDIVVHARSAQPGTRGASAAVLGTTWDDSTADDTSAASFNVAAAPPAPAAVTPPPAKKPGAGAKKPTKRLRALKMKVRKITKRRGRVQRCGTSYRKSCRTTRIRKGRRTKRTLLRATSRPLPATAARRINVVIQRRIGRRWVKKGGGDVKLNRKGVIEFDLPEAMRAKRSSWRIRTYVGKTRKTRAARSGWFYVRVR